MAAWTPPTISPEIQAKINAAQAAGLARRREIAASRAAAPVIKQTAASRAVYQDWQRHHYGSRVSGKSGFVKSFETQSAANARKIGYKGGKVSGRRVGVDLDIRPDPAFQAFMRRLPRASPEVRRAVDRAIGTAIRQEILPVLRKEIPLSRRKGQLRRAGKLQTGLGKAVPVGSRKRGRTIFKGKKVHLRTTVAARKEAKSRSHVDQHWRITVGNSDLWYSAALHSKNPFFVRTIERTWRVFNRRVESELRDVLRWVAKGERRRVF